MSNKGGRLARDNRNGSSISVSPWSFIATLAGAVLAVIVTRYIGDARTPFTAICSAVKKQAPNGSAAATTYRSREKCIPIVLSAGLIENNQVELYWGWAFA
jgi:hypothetical protein